LEYYSGTHLRTYSITKFNCALRELCKFNFFIHAAVQLNCSLSAYNFMSWNENKLHWLKPDHKPTLNSITLLNLPLFRHFSAWWLWIRVVLGSGFTRCYSIFYLNLYSVLIHIGHKIEKFLCSYNLLALSENNF
jgi:hypothetical protein